MEANESARFGLLGRTLGHSWSPQIHARLGSTPYALFEREPDEVEAFLREGSWHGINVTIPYKRAVAQLADERTERVEALGAANTLVRRGDGSILAENTDVLGFWTLLSGFCEKRLGGGAREVLEGRKALVLGTGGAAQAVSYALEAMAGARVAFVSRSGPSNYGNLTELHADAALVVNTTPVGMYPHCPASPLEDGTLERLKGLVGVLDVVYNPIRTGICLQAERLGLPFESGLAMLVWQAHHASELFQGITLDKGATAAIVDDLRAAQTNIALIGMPGAGKTTTGRALARLLGRPFIDLDDAFAVEVGSTAGDYIRTHGEEAFRERETQVVASYGGRSGLVIACGGGVVTQERNYPLLHQNATIAFIDRPLHELSVDRRPLSQTKGVLKLAMERMELYRAWADVAISCTGSAQGDAILLKARLGFGVS